MKCVERQTAKKEFATAVRRKNIEFYLFAGSAGNTSCNVNIFYLSEETSKLYRRTVSSAKRKHKRP